MKIFRDNEGNFYKIPQDTLDKYKVPLEKVKQMLEQRDVDGAHVDSSEDDVVGQAHQRTLPGISGDDN